MYWACKNHTFNATPTEKLQNIPLFLQLLRSAELRTTFTSWSQHHFVAIGYPERYVRKASQRGSKQQ